jgi:hypothetical protein
VEPLEGNVVHARLFGRDPTGRWHPLAAHSEPHCHGALRFRLSASTPALNGLRVTVHGDLPASGFALHELWAEGS